MRENRSHGSEGGEGLERLFSTPIVPGITAIKLSVEIPYTWSTNLGLYSGSRNLKESKNMFFDSIFLNLMAVIARDGKLKYILVAWIRLRGLRLRHKSVWNRYALTLMATGRIAWRNSLELEENPCRDGL